MEFVGSAGQTSAPGAGIPKGGVPRVPVGFGMYEMSRFQKHKGELTSWALDTMPQHNEQHEATWRKQGNNGDPGRYNPYEYEDSGTNPEHNSSCKNRKAFDSTGVRSLFSTLFGLDTPSIGAYPIIQPEKTLGELNDKINYPNNDNTRAVFGAKEDQRPSAKQKDIGIDPGRYNPNVMSTRATVRDAGAQMRSKGDRFNTARFKEQTGDLGPGSYRGDKSRHTGAQALMTECEEEIGRMSKLSRSGRIGFGTTCPQRGGIGANYGREGGPGPGHYEPFQPRMKHRVLAEFANVQAVTDNDVTGTCPTSTCRASIGDRALLATPPDRPPLHPPLPIVLPPTPGMTPRPALSVHNLGSSALPPPNLPLAC
jgi:hypothetical protein